MDNTPKPDGREENTLRPDPFIVPWTWGEYYAVRYLAGTMGGKKLTETGIKALHRGLQELAKETVADHIARGKPVPQRLALMARGELSQNSSSDPQVHQHGRPERHS